MYGAGGTQAIGRTPTSARHLVPPRRDLGLHETSIYKNAAPLAL